MFNSIDFTKLISLFLYDKHDPLLFGSSLFLFFFFFVLIIYRAFAGSKNLRIYSLIFFSLFFYYKAAGFYFLLLVLMSTVNFYSGRWIFSAKTEQRKKIIFMFSIIVNIGLLFYFKYINFFLQILTDLKLGTFNPLDIFLPVGISFFTFKALSYVIEIYIGILEPINSLRNFSLFVFFFPNLLMGPIDRASKFLPQIEKDYSLTKDQIGKALFLILCGLFKKFVIADYISLNFTDRVYDAPFLYTGVENLIAIYGSLLQIYCDFSGYTDMALGVALLFGFELMDNFRRPFKARSIADFWRRWHISLSSWMLDYLFRPLQIKFRNMKMYGVALAVLITFFIIGLWHGPNFTFIFFGLLHSFYIIFSIFTQKYRDKFYDMLGWRNSKTLKFFQIFFTFNLIALAAMFFKVPSLSFAMDMMKQIFYAFHPEVFMQFISAYSFITFLIALGFILHYLPDSIEVKTQKIIAKLPLALQALLFTLMIWLVVQVKFTDMQRFIYFDF